MSLSCSKHIHDGWRDLAVGSKSAVKISLNETGTCAQSKTGQCGAPSLWDLEVATGIPEVAPTASTVIVNGVVESILVCYDEMENGILEILQTNPTKTNVLVQKFESGNCEYDNAHSEYFESVVA